MIDRTFLPPSLAIAVSGGADSMALLHMLVQHKTPDQHIVALTVDHGLRVESRTEAEQVTRYCRTLNIPHHILTWSGEKPRSGLQAKARTARRELLIAKCKELGISDLYLAHQADDQAETILQRLARGTGPSGLHGLRTKTKQNGVTLHRPLLRIRRAELRNYCAQNNIPFIDDPSNDDVRFERIQWRKIVQQIELTRPDFVMGLLRTQRRVAAQDRAVSQLGQDWLVSHKTEQDGKIILSHAELKKLPHAMVVTILRSLMVTDHIYKVDLERLEDWVEQAFAEGTSPQEHALTLGGWWLRLSEKKLTIQTAPPRK